MSTSSDISLGALRIQSKQRSDMENNPAISDPEWNQYISQSYKELFDLLVAAYGNEYEFATTYQFTTTNSQNYALPDGTPSYTNTAGGIAAKFYKLLGVDLQYSASPSGWLTLRRYEMIERNRFAMPNTQTNWIGYTNLRYRLQGNNIYLAPLPQTGQLVQLWYVPAPTSLQYMLPGYTVSGAAVVGSMSDTTGLTVGMSVYASNVVPSNTTITAVSTTTFTMSQNALSTTSPAILSMWNDATTLDGISGWEEYIIVDSAIKAQIKQENPIDGLAAQKIEMRNRIEAMAEGRDAGQAQHVSDVLGANGVWGSDDFNGGGWGPGGGSW